MPKRKPSSGHCRQKGCPNTFNEVVGGDGWGMTKGKLYGDCIPCHVAAQILSIGGTLEQMASHPRMREQIELVLTKGGWTWKDLESSYVRSPVVI